MAKQFGEAAQNALAAVSNRQSKKPEQISAEREAKLHFITVMERWQAIFKRADSGNVTNDKWLLAEYFDSLGHLGPRGLDLLTKELKARCTFFPTIKECLEIINPQRYDYANPFYASKWLDENNQSLIGSRAWHQGTLPAKPNLKLIEGDGGSGC